MGQSTLPQHRRLCNESVKNHEASEAIFSDYFEKVPSTSHLKEYSDQAVHKGDVSERLNTHT